ncbi:hypothetical protein KL933_004587 [Ogataea haglerorum]|uniref:non-specific serine/threonine protein kinase n=1 Tax=Ogataea haglerorum TaxID=1937702 RepID=A0AAN6HZ03_9ASCO|nr:hypothetical protein KL933_004587 [Ogataea haglerorum]
MPYTPPIRHPRADSSHQAFRNLLAASTGLEADQVDTPNLPSDFVTFTTESPLSYSYTLLAPNSLALKLSVLKRSLEILLDRPELLSNISMENSDYFSRKGPTTVPLRRTSTMTLMDNVFRMERRVSQSSIKSLPGSSSELDKQDSVPTSTPTNIDEELRRNLKEIISILEMKEDPSQIKLEKVVGLHTLSLNPKGISKSESLRKNLLYALATPFTDNSNTPAHSYLLGGLPVPQTSPSTLGLVSLGNKLGSSNRQFHLASGGKAASPKAYFTCEAESPWKLKNANDFACLMFGISKASLASLSVMDLIAPRARDLVLDRLCNGKELVFSGEIIAIKRNNMPIAWTSLWAKRKHDLIILIFEQVPCDHLDFIVECRDDGYYIKSSADTHASLFRSDKEFVGAPLSRILPTMSHELASATDDTPMHHSATINRSRYYTLRLPENEPVPCAVTSEPLENGVVRVNLHSLPYISGAFVISSRTLRVISFNHAIASNLFGTSDIKSKSIDVILPSFSGLFELAVKENPNILYQQGLVLPEHYFRKQDAILRASSEEEQDLLFLNSIGIDGLHRDGSTVKVDVQLRVMEYENCMLWITYSRATTKRRSVSRPNSVCLNEEESEDDEANGDESMPSQLSLFQQMENDLHSCGSSSDGLSRSSSMNTIANKPMERMNSLKKTNARSDSSLSAISKSASTGSQKTTETDMDDHEVHDITDSLGEFRLENIRTGRALLERENAQIARIRKQSKFFPQKIGLLRREKKITDFTVIKNLGQGAYGKVVLAQHKEDPTYRLVIKAIFKERILVDTWVRDRNLGTIPSEIQIMNYINSDPHPNVMRIVDFFEDDRCYYLETPQHGDPAAVDLFDLIEVKSDMTELECQYIFFQCCSALAHLHAHGVVHRDIKDENIIVDKDYVVKLIDYGSAAYTKNGPFGVFVGTIDYAAPEVLNGQPYEGKPQDVWAMGVLLYTLVFKENPFCNVDEIMDGGFKFPAFHEVSESCVDLIRMIMVKDVAQRPSMNDILQHPWLSGFK